MSAENPTTPIPSVIQALMKKEQIEERTRELFRRKEELLSNKKRPEAENKELIEVEKILNDLQKKYYNNNRKWMDQVKNKTKSLNEFGFPVSGILKEIPDSPALAREGVKILGSGCRLIVSKKANEDAYLMLPGETGLVGKGNFGETHICYSLTKQKWSIVKIQAQGPTAERENTILEQNNSLLANINEKNENYSIQPLADGNQFFKELATGFSAVTEKMESTKKKNAADQEANLIQYAPYVELGLNAGIQSIAAIETLHNEGILHLDIKPENMILSPTGTPQFIDLGLAISDKKIKKGGAVTAGFRGTGIFAPVKVLKAKETFENVEYTPDTDMFALGITLVSSDRQQIAKELGYDLHSLSIEKIMAACNDMGVNPKLVAEANAAAETISQIIASGEETGAKEQMLRLKKAMISLKNEVELKKGLDLDSISDDQKIKQTQLFTEKYLKHVEENGPMTLKVLDGAREYEGVEAINKLLAPAAKEGPATKEDKKLKALKIPMFMALRTQADALVSECESMGINAVQVQAVRLALNKIPIEVTKKNINTIDETEWTRLKSAVTELQLELDSHKETAEQKTVVEQKAIEDQTVIQDKKAMDAKKLQYQTSIRDYIAKIDSALPAPPAPSVQDIPVFEIYQREGGNSVTLLGDKAIVLLEDFFKKEVLVQLTIIEQRRKTLQAQPANKLAIKLSQNAIREAATKLKALDPAFVAEPSTPEALQAEERMALARAQAEAQKAGAFTPGAVRKAAGLQASAPVPEQPPETARPKPE